MTPSIHTEQGNPATGRDIACAPPEAEADVLEALLDALAAPDRYRLVQRDGEIFIERASRADWSIGRPG